MLYAAQNSGGIRRAWVGSCSAFSFSDLDLALHRFWAKVIRIIRFRRPPRVSSALSARDLQMFNLVLTGAQLRIPYSAK